MFLFSDVFFLSVHFEFFAACLLLLFTFFQDCLPVKETAGNRNGRKVHLGPGKHTAKTGFGLEKKKEN
jgi:hypothetical protein